LSDDSCHIGKRIKESRQERHWTLATLSKRSHVSISTLSKIENNQVTASFDAVVRIARALNIRFDQLLDSRGPAFQSSRHTTTRAGSGITFSTEFYDYEVHSANLTQKRMIPLHMRIRNRELPPLETWSRHEGEEFIYVLGGEVELHTGCYARALLRQGDSAYIDSSMAHAFVSVSPSDAEILSVCLSHSPLGPEIEQTIKKARVARRSNAERRIDEKEPTD